MADASIYVPPPSVTAGWPGAAGEMSELPVRGSGETTGAVGRMTDAPFPISGSVVVLIATVLEAPTAARLDVASLDPRTVAVADTVLGAAAIFCGMGRASGDEGAGHSPAWETIAPLAILKQ